jgi:thiamine-monophosphate kinase
VPPPNPTTAPRGGGVWREDVALERIAALLASRSTQPGRVAWGDDAAVLERPSGRLVVCTDAGVAGVHLDIEVFPIVDLGYRAAIAALSDLAAVGARPLGVVVAVCAPGEVDVVAVERGVVEACATAGCEVVGGDLSRSATPTVVATAVGVEGRAGAVPRSSARPGDAVLVTGALGGAAAGLRRRRAGAPLDDPLVLRHRRPAARLAEGEAAAACGATAMIDVSDGLARDVRRLASASGVGIALATVPAVEGATRDEALGGGEDYELVFCHPDAEAAIDAFIRTGLPKPLVVGEVVVDATALTAGGEPLADLGWRHGGAGD